MVETIYYAVVAIGLCIMWICAIRAWGSKRAHEAVTDLNELTKGAPIGRARQMVKGLKYEWKKISRYIHNGKMLCLEYAYQLGYLAGKEESKHE